jgi:Tfp pilus assembly protein PilV
MDEIAKPGRRLRRDSGITMIETLMAAGILVIGSVGMLALIVTAIATNNRNQIDSTQTMVAQSILEKIATTFVSNRSTQGPGTSDLVDCAGTTWTVDTTASGTGSSGAPLSGANIDFSQAQVTNWSMNYVVSTPCATGQPALGTYDVRWHLDQIGYGTSNVTETYMLTVSARLVTNGASTATIYDSSGNIINYAGSKYFSLPVTLRFLVGN